MSGLTDGDRAWLEGKFTDVHHKIDAKDSKVQKLEIDLNSLKMGEPHKCEAAIKAHEGGSWAHNPYKAAGLLGTILGLFEGAKKLFSGH